MSTMRSLAVLFILALTASTTQAQDVLVLASKEFQPALKGWLQHRKAQGHEIAVRAPTDDIRALVREVHEESGQKLRFVLLLGDVQHVPCAYVPAVIIRQWDRATRIATDNPYADLDDDEMPDLAIGRLPADSVEEARSMLERVVAFEQNADLSSWRRKLNIITGTGGYGQMADLALEMLARQFLKDHIPPAYEVTLTYAKPDSPFCAPPAEFADTVIERINEGALVVAYVGHGNSETVDTFLHGPKRYPIFNLDHVESVATRKGPPLMVFVACSTGKYDTGRDCLAELVLKQPRGPIGVIASSRVSTPYSNGILAKEVMDQLFIARAPTAGELLMQAKRRLMEPREGDKQRELLEKMAGSFYEKSAQKRADDRAEHLHLYQLFGDPCMRIPYPEPLELEIPDQVEAGRGLRFAGRAPFPGTLELELVAARDIAFTRPRGKKQTDEDFRRVYDAANNRTVARTALRVEAGAFEGMLQVPEDLAPGTYIARIFAAGQKSTAIGGKRIKVVEKKKE